jgi:homoserine O-succinyltransferase
MPIKIPNELPAVKTLEAENIFVMTEKRALMQDIRPLRILLLNLMPTKIDTETQFSRLLGNTPLQVELTLLHMRSHEAKNTSREHLLTFYKYFEDIEAESFDGMVVTGAPVEKLPFEEVTYWEELCRILDWSRRHVHSTVFVCWGAQAGLYYHYGIGKRALPAKTFGVFEHRTCVENHRLLRGFDEVFWAPHSRHTDIDPALVEACPEVEILARSEEAGLFIMANRDGRRFFVTGHPEYDPDTLAREYFRDVDKGLDIAVPANYFPDDDPKNAPLVRWRSAAQLFYNNWLNYYVYQTTPYDLDKI